jgi:hypothetical protein
VSDNHDLHDHLVDREPRSGNVQLGLETSRKDAASRDLSSSVSLFHPPSELSQTPTSPPYRLRNRSRSHGHLRLSLITDCSSALDHMLRLLALADVEKFAEYTDGFTLYRHIHFSLAQPDCRWTMYPTR